MADSFGQGTFSSYLPSLFPGRPSFAHMSGRPSHLPLDYSHLGGDKSKTPLSCINPAPQLRESIMTTNTEESGYSYSFDGEGDNFNDEKMDQELDKLAESFDNSLHF